MRSLEACTAPVRFDEKVNVHNTDLMTELLLLLNSLFLELTEPGRLIAPTAQGMGLMGNTATSRVPFLASSIPGEAGISQKKRC